MINKDEIGQTLVPEEEIQHHRVRHNSIPGTVRQYTGKFDIMHLMVRSNNIFVQYSPP